MPKCFATTSLKMKLLIHEIHPLWVSKVGHDIGFWGAKTPRMSVANQGLGQDEKLRKNVRILIVTGILGGGGRSNI